MIGVGPVVTETADQSGTEPAILFSTEPIESGIVKAYVVGAAARGIGPFVSVITGQFELAVNSTLKPDGTRSPKIVAVVRADDAGVKSQDGLLKLLEKLRKLGLELVSLEEPILDTRYSSNPYSLMEHLRFGIELSKRGKSRGAAASHARKRAVGERTGRLPRCDRVRGCGHAVRATGFNPDKQTDANLAMLTEGEKYHLSGQPKSEANPFGVSRCGCGCRTYVPLNKKFLG